MNNPSPSITVHAGGGFHWVGNGFPVRSVFGYNDLGQKLSPFLLLDYAAPYRFEPGTERRGVEEHPHRGFETVTICYQGEIEHRDSSGGGGTIGPGDVQWMTAASGLMHEEFHSEKFTKEGGTFEMVQLWVNLPARFKDADPGYQTLKNEAIPYIKLPDGAGDLRLIAGAYADKRGPARTFTPIGLWDFSLHAEKTLALDFPIAYNKAILVTSGEIAIAERIVKVGELAVIDQSVNRIEMLTHAASRLLVLSGEPLNETIVGNGPFVMNSAEEIERAFADYRAQNFAKLAK